MMKIEGTYACNANYLYDRLIDSVMVDIKQNSNKRPLKTALEGFSYQKTFSDGNKATVTITSAKRPSEYAFESRTGANKYLSSYQITPLDENHCQVKYSEKAIIASLAQRINDTIMRVLLGYQRKSKFRKMLQEITNDYKLEKD